MEQPEQEGPRISIPRVVSGAAVGGFAGAVALYLIGVRMTPNDAQLIAHTLNKNHPVARFFEKAREVDRLIEKEPEKGKLSIPTQRLLEELREEHKRLSNHESVRGIKQPNELQRAVEEARWKMARDMAFSGALLGASIGGATGAMIRRRKKTQRSVQRKVPHR